MAYPVWCIFDDGPLAGYVVEAHAGARELQISCADDNGCGAHAYARYCFGMGPAGRIAHFRFRSTLIV